MLTLFTPVYSTNVNALLTNYHNRGSAWMFGTPIFNIGGGVGCHNCINPYSFNYPYSTPNVFNIGNNYNYNYNFATNPFSAGISNDLSNYSTPNVFLLGNSLNMGNPFAQNSYNYYPLFNYNDSRVVSSTPKSAETKDKKHTAATDSTKPEVKNTKTQTPHPSKTAKTNQTSDTAQTRKVEAQKRTARKVVNTKISSLNAEILNVARKYSDCKESDNSHLKFCVNSGCNKYNLGEWCTDYVTYVTKEAYRNKGAKLPEGFGDHDVENLKKWAISSGYFARTSNISNKGKYIAKNIKPGDIFILNEGGASHTGFVTKVFTDGSFSTIEGNRYDKVGGATYSPNHPDLSGFIQLS